ncbi:MAG: TIGR03905 family TSCPD domain-containing protein [Lachnospiraceae bacterium]|nr:TIGR03905 family TSCPD domain-containing protein [Lachnospiraceae bacterium]
MYEYRTQGTCATKINFDIVRKDDRKVVTGVKFTGGCSGNTQGVARLVEGMEVNEAISRMEGIKCGFKPTSCPDQLANALKSALLGVLIADDPKVGTM